MTRHEVVSRSCWDGKELLYRELMWKEPSATEGHRYFYIRHTIKYPRMEKPPIELEDWEGQEIPKSSLFVPFDQSLGFTVAPQPLPEDSHLKQSTFTYYDLESPEGSPTALLSEVQVCEVLRTQPHPNVAEYQGVFVEGGWIAGLVFKKYHCSLAQAVEDGINFDATKVLADAKKGVEHIHKLGYAHNDIKASNIMFTDSSLSQSIIIDFDSAHPLGYKFTENDPRGTHGWMVGDSLDESKKENDEFSLSVLEKYLEDPVAFIEAHKWKV